MLDSQEAAALTAPVATAERRLELLGPVWRAPSLRQVLRGLPFMREQPDHVQQAFARCELLSAHVNRCGVAVWVGHSSIFCGGSGGAAIHST
jgi:hypothetical protein